MSSSRIVVVPASLDVAINRLLDTALKTADAEAVECRDHLYSQLLSYFDAHGALPADFEVEKACEAT